MGKQTGVQGIRPESAVAGAACVHPTVPYLLPPIHPFSDSGNNSLDPVRQLANSFNRFFAP